MNLITLRCFGPIGLCSFVAIRRRQRGQITTGCFGRGSMAENETHLRRPVSLVKSARSFRPLKDAWTAGGGLTAGAIRVQRFATFGQVHVDFPVLCRDGALISRPSPLEARARRMVAAMDLRVAVLA